MKNRTSRDTELFLISCDNLNENWIKVDFGCEFDFFLFAFRLSSWGEKLRKLVKGADG